MVNGCLRFAQFCPMFSGNIVTVSTSGANCLQIWVVRAFLGPVVLAKIVPWVRTRVLPAVIDSTGGPFHAVTSITQGD